MIEIQELDTDRLRPSYGSIFLPSSPWKGFQHFLRIRALRLGHKTALDMAGTSDELETESRLSYTELYSASENLARHLNSMGMCQGSPIAILAESGPEWGIAFFGTMLVGAVFIPLDSKATLAELRTQIEDCRPALIFTSSACRDVAQKLAFLSGLQTYIMDLESIRQVSRVGVNAPTSPSVLTDKGLSDTALIVYTSGSTGAAKGVTITVTNLLFQMEKLVEGFNIQENDCFLSILPLNHLLELTCGMLGVIHGGARTLYCRSLFPADVTHAIRTRKATYMITVPFFLRLMARQIRTGAETKSGFRKRLFAFWHRLAPILPEAVRRRLFQPVHQALGGRMRGFISGGAPLDSDTEMFLSRMGIRIYQGYGLTETSPVISANRPGATRLGSVGKPLPGVEIRIRPPADAELKPIGSRRTSENVHEGEILTRGPHVMSGYYGRQDLTEQVIDKEGWFGTGDVGYINEDGFIYLTGRLKSLIVLEGGKKIHPEEVESTLSCLPSIKEVCVLMTKVAHGKDELVAVVVPQQDFPTSPTSTHGEVSEMERVLRGEIETALMALSAYKRPARIVFFNGELPRTASRKIRREAVPSIFGEQEG